MNFINWEPLIESLKKPVLKMIKELIKEVKEKEKDDDNLLKKARVCEILDCDGKTFDKKYASELDLYYIGNSTTKRWLRKDVVALRHKVSPKEVKI